MADSFVLQSSTLLDSTKFFYDGAGSQFAVHPIVKKNSSYPVVHKNGPRLNDSILICSTSAA
jgi:hypothetical protein